ncbi:MAG: hypothetical protein NT159_07210 [Proteobacteria bacterium]|nr:hypothetical protein [Pseudomonadota bacterium]
MRMVSSVFVFVFMLSYLVYVLAPQSACERMYRFSLLVDVPGDGVRAVMRNFDAERDTQLAAMVQQTKLRQASVRWGGQLFYGPEFSTLCPDGSR